MLSSVLKSDRAVQMSVLIVRAFVKLREMIATHKDLAHKIDILYPGIDAGFLLVACYQERKREKHKQTDEERANVLLFTCCYKEVPCAGRTCGTLNVLENTLAGLSLKKNSITSVL